MEQQRQIPWVSGLAVGIVVGGVLGIAIYASFPRVDRDSREGGEDVAAREMGMGSGSGQAGELEQLVLLPNEQPSDAVARSLRQAIVMDWQSLKFRMPYLARIYPSQSLEYSGGIPPPQPVVDNPFLNVLVPPSLQYLDAELVKVGKYFSMVWPAGYRTVFPSCGVQGCQGRVLAAIDEGKAAVAVDIVFINSSRQLVSIEATNQFRLKSGDAYFAPQGSYEDGGSGSISVPPLASVRRTIVFFVPKELTEFDLLYGSHIIDIEPYTGFHIDFSKRSIVPLEPKG